MSETTSFPFDATTEPAGEDSPDRRRLLLVIAVGVLAAAVLGYFLALTFFGGTGDAVSAGPGVSRHPAAASAAPVAPKVVPKTFNDVIGRNPFDVLVVAPVAAAAVTRTAPAAPAAQAAPAVAATTPGMTTFKVLSVSGSKATVSVDATKYTVAVGTVFAKTYKLLKTAGGSCAAFAYGEMRFSLCEGQTFIF